MAGVPSIFASLQVMFFIFADDVVAAKHAEISNVIVEI
jgi:hypothetical protein